MRLCRFHIEAEFDPQLGQRLLALVSVRNEVPEKFALEKGAQQLEIMLETRCRDEPGAQLLLYKIRNIPTVIHVTLVLLPAGIGELHERLAAPAFWI
jgi:hypothetical protein